MTVKKSLFILATLFLFIAVGALAQVTYNPKSDEEIYGTWISSNLAQNQTQKIVITAEGFKKYHYLSDSASYENATLVIDAKWTDSEGNIWYKTHGEVISGNYKGYTFQELDELRGSATVWEGEFTSTGFQGKLDPQRYPEKFHPSDNWAHGVQFRYRTEE